MDKNTTNAASMTVRTIATAAILCLGMASGAMAQEGLFDNSRAATNERYAPTIWIDPDGCEHWVMDDGVEGYMDNHLTRQGLPVCHRGNVCGVMNSDQYFATNSAKLSAGGQSNLQQFFRSTGAQGYIIAGHTDSRASDEYNINLSYRRAAAVAQVAASVGANILDVRGYGERMPKAANNTAGGMAQNRRVEIICVR